MPDPPAVAVLDVNETLADLAGLRGRFEAVGAPGHLLETWFASTLRDGFAITAAGGYVEFQETALAAMEALFSGVDGLARPPHEAAEAVMAAFAELDLHPDVAPGLTRLHEAGVRLVTLTNGSAALTRALLERGGVEHLIEQRLSVSETRRWKPAPEPYVMAAERCEVPIADVALIAAHPWDVDGAARAGMRGAWLNRRGLPYPHFFTPPAVTGSSVTALAEGLLNMESPPSS
jgi:2-haloacid dehalogenase